MPHIEIAEFSIDCADAFGEKPVCTALQSKIAVQLEEDQDKAEAEFHAMMRHIKERRESKRAFHQGGRRI